MQWLEMFAKSGADCTKGAFFGIPHWGAGLESKFGDGCNYENFALGDVWVVVANVARMALAAAALIAVGFVIYGAITYITSGGNPDNTKRAIGIITNAVVGLVIAIFASAIVGLIAGAIT